MEEQQESFCSRQRAHRQMLPTLPLEDRADRNLLSFNRFKISQIYPFGCHLLSHKIEYTHEVGIPAHVSLTQTCLDLNRRVGLTNQISYI